MVMTQNVFSLPVWLRRPKLLVSSCKSILVNMQQTDSYLHYRCITKYIAVYVQQSDRASE